MDTTGEDDDDDLLSEYGLLRGPGPGPVPPPAPPQSPPSDKFPLPNPVFPPSLGDVLGSGFPGGKFPPPKVRHAANIGLGPVDVAPGALANLQAQPQTYFRIKQIRGHSSIPNAIVIENIFVGSHEQLGSSSAPLSFFDFDLTDREADFKICQPAITITVVVRNISKVPCRVSVVLFGDAIL